MRKVRGLLLLIATLTVMTTACGTSENETMRRIYDVNQTEAILQRHETFRLCSWDYGWDNMMEDYVTRESIYLEYEDYAALYEKDDEWCYTYADESLSKYWFAMPEDEIQPFLPKDYAFLGSAMLTEENVRIVDNADHTTTITSKKNAKQSVTFLRENFPAMPKEYYAHDIECEYIVDTETYELSHLKWFLTVDGKEVLLYELNIIPDTDQMPEKLQTMLDLIPQYKECMENSETRKTITVVYEAGTKQEKSYVYTTANECLVSPMARDGYMVDFGTLEKVTDEDGTVHITLQAVRNAGNK